MATWHCIQHCGACCFLDPSERPDLEQYLSAEQLAHYLSLVGPDGWCVHFSQSNRTCQIYDHRPWFCRVEADTFKAMFDVDLEDLNDFAINCCLEQIEDVYGSSSDVMDRYIDQTGLAVNLDNPDPK